MLTPLKSNIKRNSEARAREALERKGNRLKLAVSVIICVAITFVMWNTSDAVELLVGCFVSDPTVCYLVANGLLYFLLVFVASPVYLGVFFAAARMLRGESVEIIDVFDSFSSSRSYGRALGLALNMFLRILPIVLILRLPYAARALSGWLEIPKSFADYGSVISIVAALIIVLPVASSFGFVGFAEMHREQSLRQAVKRARKARKGKSSLVFSLAYSTLLKLLLSLLSVGVITGLHTIPLALLRYASLAQELDNN